MNWEITGRTTGQDEENLYSFFSEIGIEMEIEFGPRFLER
jgi:hypothetical protein